jgi:hypothetical protein
LVEIKATCDVPEDFTAVVVEVFKLNVTVVSSVLDDEIVVGSVARVSFLLIPLGFEIISGTEMEMIVDEGSPAVQTVDNVVSVSDVGVLPMGKSVVSAFKSLSPNPLKTEDVMPGEKLLINLSLTGYYDKRYIMQFIYSLTEYRTNSKQLRKQIQSDLDLRTACGMRICVSIFNNNLMYLSKL